MKIHLNQIPPEGLHVEGTESSKILDLRDAIARPVGDVHYSLDVGMSDGGLFATGTVGAELEFQCVTCLEQFRRMVDVPDFACQVELTGAEMVDLTDPVREDILLALPPHPHCDWNGARVCPGAALPVHLSAADDGTPESEADSRKVWGALDQLKLK